MGPKTACFKNRSVVEMNARSIKRVVLLAVAGLMICASVAQAQVRIRVPQIPDLTIPTMPTLPGMNLTPPGFRPRPGTMSEPSAASSSDNGSDSNSMRIPIGDVDHPDEDVSLLVRDQDGTTVVGRYHVGVGDERFVMMPDGRLEMMEASQTQPTDQPFEPMTIQQVEKRVSQDARLAGYRTIRSKRFLFVYNTSEPFIRSTRLILETMYPAIRTYFKRSSVDVHEPEFPLVVIAFATEEDYQDYKRMPRGVIAYYSGLTNQVCLYEKSDLSRHAPEIALKNAISTIAHEGVHQILHNIGVQQRLSPWPMWISEGMAEFFAPTSVKQGGRWSGLGATNEIRMHEIDKDWRSGRKSSPGSVLQRVASAEQLTSLEYAYSWALIHMLAKRHRKELFACVRDCSERLPLEDVGVTDRAAVSKKQFEKHFGGDYAALEQELGRHLKGLNYIDPVANQTYYLVRVGSQITLTSSPDTVARLRRSGGGRTQVQAFRNRAFAEQAMKELSGGR